MQIDEKRVLIGTVTAEYARRADFYDYFNAMYKPDGTVCTAIHGQSPAKGRNLIIEQALELGVSHILFLDDDIAFKTNMLVELMKHDVDIVCGLMLMRNYPHMPLIFDRVDERGCSFPFNLADNNSKGLIEIKASGLGCSLISTDVFREMEKPWIRLGELEVDNWCDDLGFFKRAREAGFKIYCDLDIQVGHMASVTVWPNRVNDIWMTTYDSNGTGQLSTPQLKFEVLEEKTNA